MPNLLQSGVTWLAGVQKDGASVTVTLRRGESETADVAATVGKSGAEESASDGTFTALSSIDFLILAADYQIDGAAAEPADGDEIDWNGETFEVRPFAGEPSARKSDEYGVRHRVHTKKKA